MGFYDDARAFADELLAEFSQGTITLTRSTFAAPANPWEQGSETTAVYALRATARGVSSKYVDGELILASDIQVMASPIALDSDGAEASIVPQMADTITIDGAARKPKRIMPIPAAGTVAAYMVFVEG